MESFEVIREAVDRIGTKKAAADLKVSSSLVYKWCERPSEDGPASESGARNPLDRLVALYQATGDQTILQWVCRMAGGYFVQDEEVACERIDQEYIARTQRMIGEFSDLLQVVSESMENDGRIDCDEAARIRNKWQELKSYGESFVDACEQGCFDNTNNSGK